MSKHQTELAKSLYSAMLDVASKTPLEAHDHLVEIPDGIIKTSIVQGKHRYFIPVDNLIGTLLEWMPDATTKES